jgi:hypothetical protein
MTESDQNTKGKLPLLYFGEKKAKALVKQATEVMN